MTADLWTNGWQTGPITESAARKIFNSIATALDYAHSRGIIHRDVKPANIMETKNGSAKLMDFGMATPLTELDPTTGIAGTSYYLAPELVTPQPASAKSDYFALGMTMLELLLGHRPIRQGSFKDIWLNSAIGRNQTSNQCGQMSVRNSVIKSPSC